MVYFGLRIFDLKTPRDTRKNIFSNQKENKRKYNELAI